MALGVNPLDSPYAFAGVERKRFDLDARLKGGCCCSSSRLDGTVLSSWFHEAALGNARPFSGSCAEGVGGTQWGAVGGGPGTASGEPAAIVKV